MSKCAVHCPGSSAVASVLSALSVIGLAGGGLWVLSSLGAMIPVAVPFIITPIAVAFVVRTVIVTNRADLAGADLQEEDATPEPELVALPAPRKALPATPAVAHPKIPVASTSAGEPVHSIHSLWRNQS